MFPGGQVLKALFNFPSSILMSAWIKVTRVIREDPPPSRRIDDIDV